MVVFCLGFLVPAFEFLVQGPVDGGEQDVAAEEYNPVVPSETCLDEVHFDEHERPCDEEQRGLAALVAQRESALVAHDGVHHRKTCTKSAHEPLDEHEPRDDARDGWCLDIEGEGSLVACPRLVGLLLE